VLKAANNELQEKGKEGIYKPLRHYVLRHSFGTNAMKTRSFSIVELKEFMVHTSINTTIVYVTLAADALKDPAAKFGDYTVTKK